MSPKPGPTLLRSFPSSRWQQARKSGAARAALWERKKETVAAAEPEEEEPGLEYSRESLRPPVFAGRKERGLAGGVCRDAGAGGAEGGSSPPGAAQCGGSFQPVSGARGDLSGSPLLSHWHAGRARRPRER